MDAWLWIVIAAVLVVIVLLVAMGTSHRARTRSARLRGRFGPEYDHVVDDDSARSSRG